MGTGQILRHGRQRAAHLVYRLIAPRRSFLVRTRALSFELYTTNTSSTTNISRRDMICNSVLGNVNRTRSACVSRASSRQMTDDNET